MILVPIEPITISEIRRLIVRKLRIFHTPLLFGTPLPIFHLEFNGEVKWQETRVMGLLCGEGCVILTSTVFWLIHLCDGQMDDGIQCAIAYMLSRAKNLFLSNAIFNTQ